MAAIAFYIATLACLVQLTGYIFDYLRTGQRSLLWLGVPAFTLMSIGMVLTAVMSLLTACCEPLISHEVLRLGLHVMFLLGSLLWIVERVVHMHTYLVIEKHASRHQ